MKKIVLALISVLAALLCSCSLLEKEIPVLGIITFGDSTYINLAHLENKELYSTFTLIGSEGSEADAIQQIAEKKPFAIAICGPVDMNAVISEVKKNNIPVLFIASSPDTEALSQYDKAWCFSANEKQGGELLGAKIGNAFKDKQINDQNLDDILQCLEVTSKWSAAVNSAIQSAADLGVYTSEDKITAATREEAQKAFAELYAEKMPPELILCENEQLALGIDDALKQTGKTAQVSYIHNEITKLKISKPSLFAAALFPCDEMTKAANAFIKNIYNNEAVNNDTEYRLDKYKTVYFVYSLT